MASAFQRIKAAKGSKKDSIYVSLSFLERAQLIEKAILGLPAGTYTLDIQGRIAPALTETISSSLGTFAGTDVNEKMIRGLACIYPEKINAVFTLGLQEITIKAGRVRK